MEQIRRKLWSCFLILLIVTAMISVMTYTVLAVDDFESGQTFGISVDRSDAGDTGDCSITVSEQARAGDRVRVDITLMVDTSLISLGVTGDNTGEKYEISLDSHRDGSLVYRYIFNMPSEPVTVSVVFGYDAYPLAAGDSVIGVTTFSVDGHEVTAAKPGDKVTVTSMTPDFALDFSWMRYTFTEDNIFRDPVVDGASVKGDTGFVYTGTFTMRAAPTTIEAGYRKPFVIEKDPQLKDIDIRTNMKLDRAAPGDEITVESVSGKMGCIAAADEWEVTYTDDNGKRQKVTWINGGKASNRCSFIMPCADVYVNAKGIRYLWQIEINNEGCEVNVDKTYASAGEKVTVTAAQSADERNRLYLRYRKYEEGKWVYYEMTPAGNGVYTFTMPDKRVEIYARYGLLYLDRTWEDGKLLETVQVCPSGEYSIFEGSYDKEVVLSSGWYLVDGSAGYTDAGGNPKCYECIYVTGNTRLILTDKKWLLANDGIYIQNGAKLTIYEEYGSTGGISAMTSGKNEDAAIGGIEDKVGGDLVIKGGTIEAFGNTNAAGIGGGNHRSGMGDITIYGGTVKARGGSSGAGIGKGQQNNEFGTITIYGGNVTAEGGNYGAGIGGGEDRAGCIVYIYGGEVSATGGENGAGIGGGENADGGELYIENATVTATGGEYGAGIGGGAGMGTGQFTIETVFNGGTVNIGSGHVRAAGGDLAAGIGGGFLGRGATVHIENAVVEAAGGDGGAGIGGGYEGDGDSFYMLSGTVTAIGGMDGAGIGGGYRGDGGEIRISGGRLTATGNVTGKYYDGGGAGIGGGVVGDGGRVIIENEGTVVTATAPACTAGIGGGDQGAAGEVIINGGKVTATAGDKGVGIGSHGGNAGTVTIQGGEVKASAGRDGKAIGQVEGDGNEGTLTLYPASSVRSGKDKTGSGSALLPAEDRVSGCRNSYALIEPCAHPDATYEITAETHRVNCSYCTAGDFPEPHMFDDSGKCTECGYQKSGQLGTSNTGSNDDSVNSYKTKVNAARTKMAVIRTAGAEKGRKAVVTWKKLTGVSGYEIALSTSKKFTKKTTRKAVLKVTAKANPSKKIIKNLKAGKKYYVKIRPYTLVKEPISGVRVKICGKWSGVKEFKAKK